MTIQERVGWDGGDVDWVADMPAPPELPAEAPEFSRFVWEPDEVVFARQGRPLRHWEQHMSLDRIEQAVDEARARFEEAGAGAARACAREAAAAVAAGKNPAVRPPAELVHAVEEVLQDLYATGRATVREELARQAGSDHDPNPATYGRREVAKAMRRRARAAAQAVVASIVRRIIQIDLQHDGATQAELQVAGEQAAGAALRAEGQLHATPALNIGRADEMDAHADEIAGVRYTSILDDNRCEQCERADDDVLRPLDDPVRIARKPPNADCYGGDRCRCLEFAQLTSEAPPSA